MKTIRIFKTVVAVVSVLLLSGSVAAHRPSSDRVSLPVVQVKSNMLYRLTLTLNAGIEIGLSPRTTFEIFGGYNPWTFGDQRKVKFWMIQPEARFWFCERFNGHFLGLHGHYADYNAGGFGFLGMSGRRYEGHLYGAGISYGYRWIVGRRLSIETTLGLGYIRSEYDRYVSKRCGRFLGSGHRNYFGPTRIGVIFCFTIG